VVGGELATDKETDVATSEATGDGTGDATGFHSAPIINIGVFSYNAKHSSSSISVPSASSNTLQSAGSVIPNFTLPKINLKRRSFTKL
jgi:hypothetical protein